MSLRDDAMTLDIVDEELGSLMDMGGILPDDHSACLLPAVPVNVEGFASCQNVMALLDAPAYRGNPKVDGMPTATAQRTLHPPEMSYSGLQGINVQEVPLLLGSSRVYDSSASGNHTNTLTLPKRTQYATAEDWKCHRALFTQLYIHENKTLKEVQFIMREQYGFNATQVSPVFTLFATVS
jgi:hypothetical protein